MSKMYKLIMCLALIFLFNILWVNSISYTNKFVSKNNLIIKIKQKAKLNNVNKKEVISPYTSKISDKKGLKIVLAIIVVVVLLVVGYFVMSNIKGNDFQDENIKYTIRR